MRDGAATLTGHVDTEATRRAAVELAHNVFAVVDVINKLTGPVSRWGAPPQSPKL